MLSCASLDPLVTPYIDDELPPADREAVAEHLRACPPCYSRVTAERAVRDVIRARKPELGALCASDTLRARCTGLARLRAPGATAPRSSIRAGAPSWRDRLGPFAVAASLVLIVGGAFVYEVTDRSARVMAAELTADHVKCFAVNDILPKANDAAAVESAMASSFGWQMHLPAGAEKAGLQLVGSRMCLYGEGRIAHIMYRHDGRPVSLFMLPNAERSHELVKVLGHEAAIWCVGHRTFVLLAREPRDEVQRLASFVQASLH